MVGKVGRLRLAPPPPPGEAAGRGSLRVTSGQAEASTRSYVVFACAQHGSLPPPGVFIRPVVGLPARGRPPLPVLLSQVVGYCTAVLRGSR